jgi:signal transduction histidine kinase
VYSFLGLTVSTAILCLFRHWLQWGDIELLYLPLIIVYSIRFGFGPALLAAVLSWFACDYYFIPPYYTFLDNTPKGWLSLTVFLFAAISTARLASRIRDEARAAEERERETTMLYEASQAVSTEVDAARLLPTLAAEIVRISGASECAVFQYVPDDHALAVAGYASVSGEPWYAGRPVEGIARAVLEYSHCLGFGNGPENWPAEIQALGLSIPVDPEASAGIYVPLHVQASSMGVLFVHYGTDGLPFTPRSERLIRTLANHAAVVIARQRLTRESEEQARQTAVVEERNRLARDVHDALSHTFTGIKFLLEAADKVGPTPEALECIAEARKLAVEGAQEARRSVLALRPVPLEEAGDLTAAIRNLALRQTAALDIEIEVHGEPFPLAPLLEEDLLRTCQEALANALRHADAALVTISLSFEPEMVTLAVKDDGVGFDPSAVPPGMGFGLTSMRQRSSRLHADFKISSRIGEGTEITIRAPVTKQ